jgi:hypothetical protein
MTTGVKIAIELFSIAPLVALVFHRLAPKEAFTNGVNSDIYF